MIISAKDFEKNELFSAEILDYAIRDNNVYEFIIPYGQYADASEILTTDLLLIRFTTEKLNYEGHGRIFEVYPCNDGSLLRVKFDGYYDVN